MWIQQNTDVSVTIGAAVDEEEEPVVTTVEVTPATPTVALGDRSENKEQAFTATVKDAEGNTMNNQTITWTLSGKSGTATALDSTTGASVTLTVDKDETAGSAIKLKATCSGVDSDEITVTVTADS